MLNTFYLDLMPTSLPLSSTEDVGATAARSVMQSAVQALISAGFVRPGMPYGAAALSYMREKHVDGSSSNEWVTEYIFTMNFSQNATVFPEIGLRIGVHRKGVISSIRVTDATITNTGNVNTTMLLAQAQTALVNTLATTFPTATYESQQARQGALLKPTLTVETVEPSGIFNYTLSFPGGKSHQRISRVSPVSGTIAHLYL